MRKAYQVSQCFLLLIIVCACCINKVNAQSQKKTIAEIDSLIAVEDFERIDKLLKQRIPYFLATNNIDTIQYYIRYIGITTEKLKGTKVAKPALLNILSQLKKKFPYSRHLVTIHLNAAEFFRNSDYNTALEIAQGVKKYFSFKEDRAISELPNLYFFLSELAMQKGNYLIAKDNIQTAIDFQKKNKSPEKVQLVMLHYQMGLLFWRMLQTDSAIHQLNTSIALTEKSGEDPYNNYRLAILQNSLGMIVKETGELKKAMTLFTAAIENAQKFISVAGNDHRLQNAVLGQLAAIYNLGGIYFALGDMAKAANIYQYTYERWQTKFLSNKFDIGTSLTALAYVANARHQYQQAKQYCLLATKNLTEAGAADAAQSADAYHQTAIAYYGLNKIDSASFFYEKSKMLLDYNLQGQYDDYYFTFLSTLSKFYVLTGQGDKASSLINTGLAYISKVKGEKSIRFVQTLKDLVFSQYKNSEYKLAIQNSEKGLKLINDLLSKSNNPIDSIILIREKPDYILYKAKAEYELRQQADTLPINRLIRSLDEATQITESIKLSLPEQEDRSALAADNKEKINFLKQLYYDLFKITRNKTYIDTIIQIHENAIYGRIRSRMDRQKAIQFSGLPLSVQKEEVALKEKMQTSLKGEGKANEKIAAYMKSVTEWNEFQNKLKINYPSYYNMRYGNIGNKVDDLHKVLPPETTIIRYIFCSDSLFALVVDKQKWSFIPLPSVNLEKNIQTISQPGNDSDSIPKTSNKLYKQLWYPLEKNITTKRVMIIPDGILYNLSFEMLSPVSPSNFAQLSKNALIHKYSISYHYSLQALDQLQKQEDLKANFVAFVPGFSETSKEQYRSKVDSLNMDKEYLVLLPLPFTTRLAENIRNSFGGTVYKEQASTADAFRKASGSNQIIHIGTHAESNNDYPEYSRLIFLKDPKDPKIENSIYFPDIYNLNLKSNLTVLTACESGKPGYQDGEGMISMAHAFNYAGSKSIMTGLWKLDEQTTSIITENFYRNIANGMSKDEALQQAKLKYLQTAEGRMLHPQYWAGLMITGDTSPIVLKQNHHYLIYFLGGFLALTTLLALVIRKQKRRNSKQHRQAA